LIEYSDTECVYCKGFHATLNNLVKEFSGSNGLAVVYRPFPIHENSTKEAQAQMCAGELGGNSAFWKYTDKLFEREKLSSGLNLKELPKIASEIGLNTEKFNACLNSEKHIEDINNYKKEVIKAGATGTPYSVIFTNGEYIPLNSGALPYGDMKRIINTILKN